MKNNKNEVQIFGVIMDIQPGTFFKDGEKFVRLYIGANTSTLKGDTVLQTNMKVESHI